MASKEIKRKVGRPKLADEEQMQKAYIYIAVSLFISFILIIGLLSFVKDKSPFEIIYSLTGKKLISSLQSKNGFIVDESYDKNNDYIMKITPTLNVIKFSGDYKYSLYELKNNKSWKLIESKKIEGSNSKFKIKIKSKVNENKTYKVKIQILNAAKIDTNFSPFGWKFSDSKENKNKFTYNVFTVKGYYSPILNNEIKEATKKKNDKITISTNKNNPRRFIVNPLSYKYNISVNYIDNDNKKVLLESKKDITDKSYFEIPTLKKTTKVTFKIYLLEQDKTVLKKLKLSNWVLEKDKKGYYYLATYFLKPDKAY